jgi:hypothetical protein
MRRLAAIQGCIAVLLAFSLAPFVHLHASGGKDRSARPSDEATVVHSHASLHVDEEQADPEHGPAFHSDHAGRAQQISIFDFQQADPGPQPALISLGVSDAPDNAVSQYASDGPTPVAHAPPVVHSSGLRSPPA